ncbi:MAG TPA: hypothetical protein VNE41_03875 [Chitinophagaceae bacterium]|nr:hypothetical protein [Chitinophagaceae bacterium]
MVKKTITSPILLISISILLITGCVYQKAYYINPMFGRTNPYIAKPLLSDFVKSANYGELTYSAGNNNFLFNDQVNALDAQFYHTNQVNLFHFYYGGNLSLGNYRVSSYSNSYESTGIDTAYLNAHSGYKFFGNLGIQGGADFTLPLGKSEWRFIGVDISVNREFGQYLNFRRSLKDTMVSGVTRSAFLATLGISSEMTFHLKNGNFGWKLETGTQLGNLGFEQVSNSGNTLTGHTTGVFFDFVFQVTYKQWTGYFEAEQGTLQSNDMLGLIYKIGSKRYKTRNSRIFP